ncbi:unnamed protein product [Didymodactylos carnosus]|uniref:Uncharacterized protein n=1 Tax=Didymodactylos carnosus TaxID=1234261 RepID=A0A814KJ38_9BILA|nr:unnamed protein product [Didymodactylos carnosus]CAF1053148.1 unnamed protein product [Didymodactylos carnosus]CAF3648753.1 unnamed protein product [Didymodactylos carnosus]CAF3822487.1 unnamed protein product [Didymodactylos carnosus]
MKEKGSFLKLLFLLYLIWPISEDAVVKITVYHQHETVLSKGDFISRAYITLRNLQDYERAYKSWYTLMSKDGKADKDRGEIEVSL